MNYVATGLCVITMTLIGRSLEQHGRTKSAVALDWIGMAVCLGLIVLMWA